ncbi:MAG: glucose-1-phosphate adenylyltransferase subunit GlgD [Clostridia bacterium]|nr:glucose-1-phosphate adenylyltransferase subunit GlgD [Clostridia bacterium]
MKSNNMTGIIFGYVHEEGLRELTGKRMMASIPFGCRYRVIDFTVSNMVNSGMNKIGIVTNEKYHSLMNHIGSGKAYGLARKREGLFLLPPFGTDNIDGNKVEVLHSIQRFIKDSRDEYVLLADVDIIANINYNAILEKHIESGADITAVYRRGPAPAGRSNTVFSIDVNDRISEVKVGKDIKGVCNYSMGLYIMKRTLLLELVEDCMSHSAYNFDRDLIQKNVALQRILGYEYTHTAFILSSTEEYFKANMALTDPAVMRKLFDPKRPIYANVRDDMPAKYGLGSDVSNCVVADGCVIEGEVENCVLFRGVKIGKGSKVRNCVLMRDTVIGENCRMDNVIVDKNVKITEGKTLIGEASYPVYIGKGKTV